MYKLILHSDIEKTLQKIPRDFAAKIAEAMRDLRDDPRPPGIKKIAEDLYRLRQGDYRIIYSVIDNGRLVLVLKVARRSEKTYRDINNLVKVARLYLEQEKLKK